MSGLNENIVLKSVVDDYWREGLIMGEIMDRLDWDKGVELGDVEFLEEVSVEFRGDTVEEAKWLFGVQLVRFFEYYL